MFVRLKFFGSWQFAHQLLRLVDENRKVAGADGILLSLKFHPEQWNLLTG